MKKPPPPVALPLRQAETSSYTTPLERFKLLRACKKRKILFEPGSTVNREGQSSAAADNLYLHNSGGVRLVQDEDAIEEAMDWEALFGKEEAQEKNKSALKDKKNAALDRRNEAMEWAKLQAKKDSGKTLSNNEQNRFDKLTRDRERRAAENAARRAEEEEMFVR